MAPESIGPVPPPENFTATVEAFGTTEPSDANTSVGSVATHAPSRHTRTAWPYWRTVNEPSGCAHVSVASVRADVNS
ncbi:hypothetical protein GCM10010326_00030 [Streptomyces xanthochromogenes]|uniref:Uncharacterized protein n=1 Tax=Streptomyces xanthochromogenes TaxID=67384 RepID=A0ABQ2ZGF1_9ACTN|nr:hypothetical protein GCM10010326_00030 [Streptomyces xanthochromogenes]